MIRRFLIAAIAMGASAPCLAAANDCRVDALDIQPDAVTALYDPFDATPVSEEFRVTLRTSECPSNRNLFLTIDAVNPNSFDGRVIRLWNDSNDILVARVSDRSNSQGGRQLDTFNLKEGLTPLYLLIERGQVVRPGLYRASMRAFATLNQGNNTPQVGQPFEVLVTVAPAVGLAAASGSELDLGELSDQDRAVSSVTFDAYANVAYELSLSSDNDFNLRRGGTMIGGIAYRPVVDDNMVSTARARVDFASPHGEENRRRHRLNVVVPQIGDAAAGRYRDYLTVTINPKFGG